MDAFFRDVRHSIRMFFKNPGFTITVVAALALGIGATTGIFSIVNTVLLRPIPVPDPDRFVMLMNTGVSPKGESISFPIASPAKFQHWRSQSSVIQYVSAFRAGVMNYTGGDVVEQLQSMQASADIFRSFGIRLLRGRGFTPEEDLPNGPLVALISENLWNRRFARDPEIMGKIISLSGEPYTIIGIVADNQRTREFGPPPEVYVPFQLDPNTSDQGHYFQVVARLKPGITIDQAKARLQVSAQEYRVKFPKALGPKDGFTVESYREAVVGNVRSSLLVLLAAVSMVLLIACVNVANLLLVRATGRRREIAIRAAIGAGRARIIRQLLTESVLLSLAGGALGLLLGFVAIRALLAVNTAGLPRVGQDGEAVAMDWRVLVFVLLVSVATGIMFGLFPALQGSRVDINSILKDTGGHSVTSSRQNKMRSVLVVTEVGLAVILLVGSALLIRTFVALYGVEPGFDTKNVLTMRMSLTGPKYLKSMGVAQTVRDGLERVRPLPGVVAASATCCVPLGPFGYGLPFNIIGKPPVDGPFTGGGGWSTVSPGFFEVFKIPLKRGRTFTDRDDDKSPAVVVINEAMAKQFWKDSDPLRDRIAIGRGVMKELKDEPERQIIGIVGDVRNGGLNNDPTPTMYVPQSQLTDAINALNVRLTPMAWVVRTTGETHGLISAIQEQLRQTTGLPVSDIHSMDEIVSLSTARQRFNMLLMTVFGCAALLLAAIGIYGLMAYSVEQRSHEIGIRLALGADSSRIRNMVVLQGMVLAAIGVVIGIAAAFGLARFIASFLFGVKTHDPMAFILVPVLLSGVALLAVSLPAARASRVKPAEALRYE